MTRTETVRRAWLLVAMLAIVIVAGVNIVTAVRRTPPAPRVIARPPNAVMRHEERWAPVRRALEVREVRGTVGYVGDLPPEQLRADWRAMDQYFMTQFALVPWVLETDIARCEWVVANLHRAPPAGRVPSTFRLVQDFGGGVLLLQRVRP